MNSRGGSAKPREPKSRRRGVTGVRSSGRVLSSLEVLRDASMMCGEGDSLTGVPPPSDMDRFFVKGDRPWVLEMESAPACSSMTAESSYGSTMSMVWRSMGDNVREVGKASIWSVGHGVAVSQIRNLGRWRDGVKAV